MGGAHHRADYWHRPFLARPYPAGKDCRKEKTSTDQGNSVPLPAIALFGGLLWPIAWLLAYTKPVLHKMAYGTDVDESPGHHGEKVKGEEEDDLQKLRARVAELEAKNRLGR